MTHALSPPLSPDQAQALHLPGTERLRNAYTGSLAMLQNLAAPYSSSITLTAIPDRELAYRLLHESLAEVGPAQPYAERLSEAVSALAEIEGKASQGAPDEEVRALADELLDEIVTEYMAINNFPRTATSPARQARRATG